nr:T9SS type A sorting domain-containing protein [Nitrosopumilus sp.]
KILELRNSNEIDLSNTPNGIYFVKIYKNSKIYTTKIVVQ